MAFPSLRRLLPLSLVCLALAAAFLVSTQPTAAQTALSPFEQEVLNLVNQKRQAVGLTPLTVDARLVQAARDHNARMIATGQFSHQVTGELPLCASGTNNDRFDAVGYAWTACAENIAAGQTTPQQVMDAWMNSAGHKANILNPGYRHIGIGYATGGPYGYYWTQDFGAGGGSTAPLPTAPAPTATPRPANTPVPTPTQAPSASGLAITRATYLQAYRYVYIEATSGNPAATLYAYNATTGQYLGTLTGNSSGRYNGYFYSYTNPGRVTVKSSTGLTATAAVTVQ
ncbi:MAG: hypothetical protein KIT87_07980 [Anaerolineae bacterium]|nr:hypothetical protein [Anaerolineae bacterium]